jgi:hypothetical protein
VTCEWSAPTGYRPLPAEGEEGRSTRGVGYHNGPPTHSTRLNHGSAFSGTESWRPGTYPQAAGSYQPTVSRIASSGMLRRVAAVRTDVSEELSASFIRVTRIGELGIAVTSYRRTLRRNTKPQTSNLTTVSFTSA